MRAALERSFFTINNNNQERNDLYPDKNTFKETEKQSNIKYLQNIKLEITITNIHTNSFLLIILNYRTNAQTN